MGSTPALPGAAGLGSCPRGAETFRAEAPRAVRPLMSSRARVGRRPEARPLERPLLSSRAQVDAPTAPGGATKRAGASPGRPRVRIPALPGAVGLGSCPRGAETVRQAPRAVILLERPRAAESRESAARSAPAAASDEAARRRASPGSATGRRAPSEAAAARPAERPAPVRRGGAWTVRAAARSWTASPT